MSLHAKRAEIAAKGLEIVNRAKAEGRQLTDTEAEKVIQLADELKSVEAQIEAARPDEALFAKMNRHAGAKSRDGFGHLTFRNVKAAAEASKMAARAGGHGVKSLLTVGSSATLPADVVGEVVADGRPLSSVFEFIPAREITGGGFSFLRQSARDNRAAPVAEGAEKPVSSAAIERVNGELRVVAHILEGIDTYDLGDAAALSVFIRDEMGWGLGQAVERQLFNGTGTDPELHGILNTSGIRTQAFTTNAAVTIRRSLTQLEVAGYEPGGIAMNPADWESIETTQLQSGAYMLSNGTSGAPLDAIERRLWGVRVALTSALPAGTAVTIGKDAVALYHDGLVKLDWDHSRGFRVNEVDARCEGRFEVAVSRPDAIIECAIADTAGA